MKKSSLLVVLAVFLAIACSISQEAFQRDAFFDERKFISNYNFLDSVTTVNLVNNTDSVKNAIRYMEKATGIEAKGTRNYYFVIPVTKDDLHEWNLWYAAYKKR